MTFQAAERSASSGFIKKEPCERALGRHVLRRVALWLISPEPACSSEDLSPRRDVFCSGGQFSEEVGMGGRTPVSIWLSCTPFQFQCLSAEKEELICRCIDCPSSSFIRQF